MADTVTMKPSYSLTFVVLLIVNIVTVAVVYALVIANDGTRNLLAAALLAIVVAVQTSRYGPFLPALSWFSTVPVAIAMAYLIGAHPALDWSGPGEADEMNFAPIYPVITVGYAIGFALIGSIIYGAYSAFRNRRPRGNR